MPINHGENGTPEYEATPPSEDDDARADRAAAFEQERAVGEKRIREAIADRGQKAKRLGQVRNMMQEMSWYLNEVEADHERARQLVVRLKAEYEGVEVKEEEVTLSAEEEAAVAAAERAATAAPAKADSFKAPLNGFPIELNPEANAKFERLLQAKVLTLFKKGEQQVVAAGRNGTKQNVFENKELFKEVTPRFFWQPDKVWAREAPDGWRT
jgi:Zn-dependent metalloprotease